MMTLRSLLIAASIFAASPVLAQSAVGDATKTLSTIGNIEGIDGRWIWSNMSGYVDMTGPNGSALAKKMQDFCPEDGGPIMAITSAGDGGFDIGIIDQPREMDWQFRRDQYGHYSQSIDVDAFFAAMGHGPNDKRSEAQVANLERNNGPVTVIRPSDDVLLITNRNGFDMYVRCD